VTAAQAALAFGTLLVIVDPVAIAPVFGALTRDMDEARARRTARFSVMAGFALLGAAGLAGHAILKAVGANLPLAHLAVGAALLIVGAAMVAGRGAAAPGGGGTRRDPTFFPLAVPVIAGPGGMGAMVMLTGKNAGDPAALGLVYALLGLVAAITYASFRASGAITRRLGNRGVALVTRIFGALLIVAAARFLFEALRDYGTIASRGTA
jgi:multiple antibiotic resistance protein